MPNGSGSSYTSGLIQDIHTKIISYPTTIVDPFPLSYGCSGTGVSSTYNVGLFFKNKYNYSTAQYNYNYFTPHQIKILSEILQNRPVILDGGRKTGWWIFATRSDGHMWVCDGFSKEVRCVTLKWPIGKISFTIAMYHMNWGWGGVFNDYYTYGQFNPGTANYNYQIGLLYNIKP